MGGMYYQALPAFVLAISEVVEGKIPVRESNLDSFARISGDKGLCLHTTATIAAQEGLVERYDGWVRLTEAGLSLLREIWEAQEEEKEARKEWFGGGMDEPEYAPEDAQPPAACRGCYLPDCRGCAPI